MEVMDIYATTVERDGAFWLLRVEGPGGFDYWTQARNLREVETMARDLVASILEVEPDSFALDVEVRLPGEVAEHLRRAAELRDQAESAKHEAALEARRAARELRDDGLTVRDIGEALGVSYQRAHQLVSA